MTRCRPRSEASGVVSGHSHSPQTILGSGMVFGLCLTPRALTQQFPQTSLNMKHRVTPGSFSNRAVVSHNLPNVSDFFSPNAGGAAWISTLFHPEPAKD